MSEIGKLIKQIEELRINMIKIADGKCFTDPKVVAASRELDAVLDKYQEMILKEPKKGLNEKKVSS